MHFSTTFIHTQLENLDTFERHLRTSVLLCFTIETIINSRTETFSAVITLQSSLTFPQTVDLF